MQHKLLTPIAIGTVLCFNFSYGQNIAINTDGTVAETGVILDVKGTNPIGTTASQNVFQIKSFDASGNELKFRMILGTHATTTSRYGALEVYDQPAGLYRHLVLQPTNGNVGIGTTTPAWPLDVVRNQNGYTLYGIRNNNAGGTAMTGMIVYNDNAPSAGIFGLTSTGWNTGGPYPTLGPNKVIIDANTSMNGIVLNTEGAQPIVFATTMAERMRVDGNGNVGIGTTTPSYKLQVFTSDPAKVINSYFQYNPVLAANQAGDLISSFSEMYANAGAFTFGTIYGSANRVSVLAGQAGTVNLTVGSLDDLYHYGAGTVNNARGTHGQIVNTSTGIITSASALFANVLNQGAGSITNGYGLYVSSIQATNKWSIYASDATVPSYFAGNVGIGTTVPTSNAPGKVLHVHEASTNASVIHFTNATTGAAAANGFVMGRWVDGSYGNGIIFWNYASTPITFATGSIQRMFIDGTTGNVGIACTSPQYPLHVVGDAGVVGTIYATAASVTAGVLACSDIRYKKDIIPLSNSLNRIMKLQGVNYFWKSQEFPDKQFTNTIQIGFIAQEIEKIYPEVVMTDDKGYKSVDYSRLTPILVEAIKEQQKLIDTLSEKISRLENALKAAGIQTSEEIK